MVLQTGNPSCIHIIKHVFEKIGLLIVGSTVIILLLFMYAISSPVFVFRFIIGKVAKLCRPDLKAFVSPQGNIFSADLFSQNAPRCSLIVPLTLEGADFPESEYIQRFCKMIDRRDPDTGKPLYPEYKQYVEIWWGFALWKNDPHFDIRKHVTFFNAKESETAVSPKEVADLTESLLNKNFEPGKSPWEACIVFNYNDPELSKGPKTVMIMRVHHTLADGFSILYSLVEGFCQASFTSVCKLPTPTFAERNRWNELWFKLSFPVRLAHDVGNYFVKITRKNPFNVPDSRKAWKQYYGRANLVPVHKIKEIKDKLGVSFTSVLLAAVSASLSVVTRTKQSKDDSPIDRASFFIPLPVKGSHPNAMVNHVTGAQIDLPMVKFSDPIERVWDCDKQVAAQKASTIPWLLHFLANTLGYQFSSICGVSTANRVNVAGLTNFPVAINDLKVHSDDEGKEIKLVDVELAAGALIGIAGLAFMSLSYGKYIRFSITAESSVLTKADVETLLAVLVEEIDVLHRTVYCGQCPMGFAGTRLS